MSEFQLSDLFSTKTLTRKTVEACGQKFDVFVRRLPAVDLRKFVHEQKAENIADRAEAGFDALVKAIRKEDGTALATRDDYKKMDADAVSALIRVFMEVNGSQAEEVGNA